MILKCFLDTNIAGTISFKLYIIPPDIKAIRNSNLISTQRDLIRSIYEYDPTDSNLSEPLSALRK